MGSITDSEHQGDASTKRTYRVNEVAKILGVSNATAYRLIKEGHFEQSALVHRLECQGSPLTSG